MAKQDVNSNFEKLKAEMMKKKVNAMSMNTVEDENIIANEDENKTEDVNTNKVENNNVNINKYEEDNNDSNTSISSNKIVIKKAKKVQPPKRITYYLNVDTIKKIDKYSKLTGMGKSELVQTLLEVALDNLEVTN